MRSPVRCTLVSLALVSLSVTSLPAQHRPKLDVGMHAGATILIPSDGRSEYVIGLPGGGTFAGLLPPVYVTFFARPSLMVEPQLAFAYQSFTGTGLLNIALQLGYLTRPTAGGSLYLAGHLLAATAFGDGSSSEFAAGASVGYRHVVKEIVGLRYEARYRRWFDVELHEVALLVGLGVAIR